MGKIELLLLDEDELYGERLALCAERPEFAARVRVRLFTRMEQVELWLAGAGNRGQIMLAVSDEFYHLARKVCADVRAAVISESFAGCGSDEGLLVLYKFRPLHEIVGELLAYFEQAPGKAVAVPVHRSQILTVYSAVGGSGKTTTALHVAQWLAFRGQRVFYLGFEPSAAIDRQLHGEQPSRYTELMQLAAQMPPGQLAVQLERMKSHAPLLGIDFIAPSAAVKSSFDVGGQEVRCLLEALLALNSYECIIVDTDSSLHPRVRTALDMSDAVWWLVLDDFSCLHKTGTYRKLLPPLKNVRFVVNQFMGECFNEFERHDVPISGILPYMPQWKNAEPTEANFADSPFAQRVHQLYAAMMFEALDKYEGQGESVRLGHAKG
ncbi:AAA family ATPase [Paenibacillus athensensis]|uniref:AAA domain-containing protein n=1 Tax=Paenibacillus athensensis TaxID=1967502 RepID=A0A4Y8QBL5_9BACL|nr:AAA family ATPase [Paenibacillus athensensis]MCD1257472.1 AAA family ATPase [Paenibacillus athensensis]